MKERPIIFSGKMVKAILRGDKTQTRRVIRFKEFPNEPDLHNVWLATSLNGKTKGQQYWQDGDDVIHCPYAGARLWVKESHYLYGKWIRRGKTKTGKQKWSFRPLSKEVLYLDNPPEVIANKKTQIGWFKRVSIHMPRWASRLTLEIVNVRVERVQKITAADAKAEGVETIMAYHSPDDYSFPLIVRQFAHLWNEINFKRGFGWGSNPWVWVIEFKNL